ncbi:MAG: hypothetical protein NTY19_51875 [Planctomycetota bacterium]|nr:hypothetical protein [Planctomycetota bacterium]
MASAIIGLSRFWGMALGSSDSEEAIPVWPVATPDAFLADRPTDELVL